MKQEEDLQMKSALKKISKKAGKEYKKLFQKKSHQYGEYKEVHDSIMQLSFVKELVKENKNLKLVINYYVKRNIALKSRLKDLAGENDEHISLKIEETDPVLNESLDKMYEILGEKDENLKDSVEESESSEKEAEEQEKAESEEEEKAESEAEEEAENEAEEEEEKEEAESEAEEEEAESEAEEAESEAEEEEEEEKEETTSEEVNEETKDDASCETETKAESEIEEEEFFEIVIKKVTYCTNNETNGDIYLMENDEMGDKVGYFKNGKAIFTKK